MNDLPPEADDLNGNNNTPPDSKPTNPVAEIFLGLGVAALAYLLPIIIVQAGLPNTILSLAGLIFFAVAIIVNVKLFKSQHRIAAITLLVAISPLYLGALLFGACTVLFSLLE